MQGEGQGEVIHVDRFGNLITSFEGSRAPTGTWELEMEWNDRRLAVVAGRTYSDVTPGGLVLYPGSSGQIELAVRDGSAAERDWGSTGNTLSLAEDRMMAGKIRGVWVWCWWRSPCRGAASAKVWERPVASSSCSTAHPRATTAMPREYAELHRRRRTTT